MTRGASAIFLVLSITLTGCGSTTGQSVTEVDAAEAASLIENRSELVVLDVRTPEEADTGTIPGAIVIDVTAPGFADRVGELDRSVPYLVYCRSGNRSAEAVSTMADLGFAELYELESGIGEWVAAGFDLSVPG